MDYLSLKSKRELADQAKKRHGANIMFPVDAETKPDDLIDTRIWIELTDNVILIGIDTLLADLGYKIDYGVAPVRGRFCEKTTSLDDGLFYGGFYDETTSLDNGMYIYVKPIRGITRPMVKEGLKAKIIELGRNPIRHHGTVAQIGDQWFGFGGRKAASLEPDDYAEQSTEDEIVDAILCALDGIKENNAEGYEYCWSHLA